MTTMVQNDGFYSTEDAGGEASVELVEGKSYYMEVFHLNWSGPGFIKTEVEVPKKDGTSADFFVNQVDKITTSVNHQKEVVRYTMSKGASGDQINLQFYRSGGSSDPYIVSKTIDYDCSASTFKSTINQYDFYKSWYGTTVTKTYVDVDGSEVATEADCQNIYYTI